MLLSTIMDLKTRQVDYTQAFPKAELHDPVCMRIPQGWYGVANGILQQHENPKHNDACHYFKLKRNLYGCKQAVQNWYKHLTAGLLAEGFIQSTADCCLFLRHDVFWSCTLMMAYYSLHLIPLLTSLSNLFPRISLSR
jgi:hypothetical protein